MDQRRGVSQPVCPSLELVLDGRVRNRAPEDLLDSGVNFAEAEVTVGLRQDADNDIPDRAELALEGPGWC